MRFLALLLIVCGSTLHAQGITLTGPSGSVEPREYAQILVSGLSDQDLPAARVEWTPTAGTTLIPARTWGGQPFLWFSARNPGRYTITVTANGWRRSLDAATREATTAKLDEALLARLAALSEEITLRYPVTSGQCAVEVAGDPIPPPIPPPPVTGMRRILLIRETSQSTPQLAALIQDLRNLPYLSEKKHSLLIFDKDTKLPPGTVPPELAQAIKDLGTTPLPAVVVYSGDDGRLCGVAACPVDQVAFIDLLKKLGG